jgi:hypothetical protein
LAIPQITHRNDGTEFIEAIDIEDSNYTYTESEKDNWHEITDEEAQTLQETDESTLL